MSEQDKLNDQDLSLEPWPGYKGARTQGKLFIINWPDEHPDSHCALGTFTPEEDREQCKSCNWIPAGAKGKNRKSLRDSFELELLKTVVQKNDIHSLIVPGHQAYVEAHKKLTKVPTLGEVQEWWNALPRDKKDRYLKKYPRPHDMMWDLFSSLLLAGLFKAMLDD